MTAAAMGAMTIRPRSQLCHTLCSASGLTDPDAPGPGLRLSDSSMPGRPLARRFVVWEVIGGSEQPPSGSRPCVVEVLEELMGGELDLLVSPLGGTVLAGDQTHPMDTPQVPIHECVSGLGVVARAISES
jgi:hypothetical protein